MGRPCTLSEKQKQEILRRSIEMGESSYTIAKAMKIPATTVRRNVVDATKTIKTAANQIVSAERELMQLPIAAQVVARDYMATLRSISNNLAHAAMVGSASAVRLSELASDTLTKATSDEGIDVEGMRLANGLIKSANDAAQLGVQLIQANKDRNVDPPKPARSLDEFYGPTESGA